MNPEVLQLIATFLTRVQLQGSEVPAYNKVMQELARIDAQNRVDAVLAAHKANGTDASAPAAN